MKKKEKMKNIRLLIGLQNNRRHFTWPKKKITKKKKN